MDDVPEQFRIFVGFFVVQIYQSSVKSNNIISDYYSGVNSAPRRGSKRRHRPEQTMLTRRLRLVAAPKATPQKPRQSLPPPAVGLLCRLALGGKLTCCYLLKWVVTVD